MSITSSFSGKVFAITGGASGMGLALARILYSRGAKVSLADWSQPGLDAAAKTIGGKEDEVLTSKCDVTSLPQVRDWMQRTVSKFGRVDGAANMAGVSGKKSLLEDQDEEDWDRTIGINLKGVMFCMKEQVKLLPPGSAIVNAASIAGVRSLNQLGAYCASKHGVVGLTKAAARDYGARGIRINAVAPGYTMTPMLSSVSAGIEDAVDGHVASLPLPRKAEPEEIAKVVCTLLSEDTGYITGQVISVDGGWTIC